MLFKFFLNPGVRAYLRELAEEFDESTNAVRVELNRLVDAKLLKVVSEGRNKFYSANTEHPLYPDIASICRKSAGLDKIFNFLGGLGKLQSAFIAGDYARGVDSGIIDLILIGEFNTTSLHEIVSKTEKMIDRKIRLLTLLPGEEKKLSSFKRDGLLPIWMAGTENGFGSLINGNVLGHVVFEDGGAS